MSLPQGSILLALAGKVGPVGEVHEVSPGQEVLWYTPAGSWSVNLKACGGSLVCLIEARPCDMEFPPLPLPPCTLAALLVSLTHSMLASLPFDRLDNAHALLTLQRPVQSVAHLRVLLRTLAPLVPRITISRAANLPLFSKVPGLPPCSSDALQVILRCPSGALQVLFRYSSGALQVLFRCSPRAFQVLSRCSSGDLQPGARMRCATCWCCSLLCVCRPWGSSLGPWETCLGPHRIPQLQAAPTPSPT